jgi:predicted nuclease of predicted toxin-antitoxin system
MLILVDECIYAAIVDALRRDQHDVRWVRIDMPRADDRRVLEVANVEGRIIVSEDRDFGELIFRDRWPSRGIISARVSEFDLSPRDMGLHLSNRIRVYGDRLIGQFTIIEPSGERQRPVPNVIP